MTDRHTIVVGAGIVGISAAYYLARRGHRVTVAEKGDVGSGASSGNAGIIAIGHPPLPRPGLVRQVLRWMVDGGSPLYLPPRLDPALFRWFWEFRKACTEPHFRACMATLTVLGRESRACFEQVLAEEPMSCEYHRGGWREVFRTEQGLRQGEHDVELLREHGFDVAIVDGAELRRREPAFKEGVVGAVEYRDSSFTDPAAFLVQLAARAEARGATIRRDSEVRDVLVAGDRVRGVRLATGEELPGDTVVLACGIWTTALARCIGIDVPMQAGKGYHRNVTRPDPCLNVASVLAERHVAVTPMGGVLRLSGTVEFSGINHRLVPRRLEMLSEGAREYLEGIEATSVVSEWCGLRPCTADGLPVVGWAPRPAGLFVATGHARMGFTLGPATGRIASECILDGRPSIDITAMRVERFGCRGRAPRPRPARGPAAAGARAT